MHLAVHFKLVVLHHPLDHIVSAPIELKSFEMIVDGGPVKDALRRHGFHLVLHGHKHYGQFTRLAGDLKCDRGILCLSGGTIGGFPAIGQGASFNWIEVEPQDDRSQWQVAVRKLDIRLDDVGHPPDVWDGGLPATIVPVRQVGPPRPNGPNPNELRDAVEGLIAFCEQDGNQRYLDYARDLTRALLPGMPMSNPHERADLIKRLDRLIRSDGSSLYAIDVLGPQLWLQPDSLTYFAKQVKPYIARTYIDGHLKVVVSPQLGSAIQQSVDRATKLVNGSGRDEGVNGIALHRTAFATPGSFMIGAIAPPNFEIARILVWSRDMLSTPTADAIIRMHEEFGIPLFFLDAAEEDIGFGRWRDPHVDYCLKSEGARNITGFFGWNNRVGMFDVDGDAAPPISLFGFNNDAPHFNTLLDEFLSFLKNRNLLLAADARIISSMKNEYRS